MKKTLCPRLKFITKRKKKTHKVEDTVVKTQRSFESNRADVHDFVNEVWRDLKMNLENEDRKFEKKNGKEGDNKISLAIEEFKSGKTVLFNLIDEYDLPPSIIFGQIDSQNQDYVTLVLDEENKKLLLEKVKNFFIN